MKILITGGCGFLGTNLSEKILTENTSELFIIDNLSRYGSEINFNWLKGKGQFTFINEDIRHTEAIEKFIQSINQKSN